MPFLVIFAGAVGVVFMLSAINSVTVWGKTCYYMGEVSVNSTCMAPAIYFTLWAMFIAILLAGISWMVKVYLLDGASSLTSSSYRPSASGQDHSHETQSAITTIPTRPEFSYDLKKWETLKEVDSDIKAASVKLSALGVGYEAELAEKYLVLSDKSYLHALVARVEEGAARKAEELKQIEQSSRALSSEKSAKAYKALMAELSENGGLDPRTGIKVTSVTEFFGEKASGWHGGLKIVYEDGSVQIRDAGRTRLFKTEDEAKSWGG